MFCICIIYNISGMQTPQEETDFHEETDTFNLTVSLQGDKLTITLKDFVDWCIYSKEYTEEDIGGEISRKMELFDVYSAFSQTKTNGDQDMEKKEGVSSKLKHYQFGTIVEHEGNACHKIQRGGKITTYLVIIDKRSKKDVAYESILKLTKVRDMTEMEILAEKGDIEKKSIFDELNKKIQQQEQEKKELLARIVHLEEENINLKQEVRLLKEGQEQKNQRFEEKITQLTQSDERIEERVNENREQLQLRITQTSQQLTDAKQQIQQNLTQTNQQLTQTNQQLVQTNQQLTQTNQRLEERFSQLMQQFELQNQRSLDKFAEMERNMKPIRIAQNLHGLTQAHSGHFKIQGLRLQYTASNAYTHYIFNQPIAQNQSTKFKVKIIHTPNTCIMLGVVDYAKQKDQRSSYSSGNAMCYFSQRTKYPQGASEGSGFKQGDILEVDVNRSTSTIRYFVNEAHQATQSHQKLADNSRVFMPFVEMYYTNDAVEWLL